MLKDAEILEIVREVANATLGSASVSGVLTEATTDSDEQEALRITIVIRPGVASKLRGSTALDTLAQIQSRLLERGETRFPIVEYATEEELQVSGDP